MSPNAHCITEEYYMKRNFLLSVPLALILAALLSSCPADKGGGETETPGRVPHDIIIEAGITNGIIITNPRAGTKVMPNVQVTVIPDPDDGYELDYVRMNGSDLPASGGTYKFNMPNENATISAAFKPGGFTVDPDNVIFNDGFQREGDMIGEHEWTGENETTIDLEGDIELEDGQGRRGGKAIKIALTKVHNYLGLRIFFDPINLNGVDGLSLYARTTYQGTGAATDKEPAINQVVFGKYTIDGDTNAGIWEYSVRYSGETNLGNSLDTDWQNIIVPLPAHKNLECDTIMLYFTPAQVEGIVYYIDRVNFIEIPEKALQSVTLPESAAIPYKTNTGDVLETSLDILTMDTRLVYKISGARSVTMFGKDGNVNVTQFLNKFTDFYSVTYNVTGGNASKTGTGTGQKIRPSAANIPAAEGPRVTATYDGKTSAEMSVEILALPQTLAGGDGSMPLVEFDKLTYKNAYGGDVQLPLYWGGTAGDAQCYKFDASAPQGIPGVDGDTWELRCYIADITIKPPAILGNGQPQDTWYVFGNLGLNHDLSGCSKITVLAKLNTDVAFTFGLSSGYPGVAETLNPAGEKLSHPEPFIGKGLTYQTYDIDLAPFWAAGVDPTCVTGFEFASDESLNRSQANIGGWAAAGQPVLSIISVIAYE